MEGKSEMVNTKNNDEQKLGNFRDLLLQSLKETCETEIEWWSRFEVNMDRALKQCFHVISLKDYKMKGADLLHLIRCLLTMFQTSIEAENRIHYAMHILDPHCFPLDDDDPDDGGDEQNG